MFFLSCQPGISLNLVNQIC